jgi:hypothetical protein
MRRVGLGFHDQPADAADEELGPDKVTSNRENASGEEIAVEWRQSKASVQALNETGAMPAARGARRDAAVSADVRLQRESASPRSRGLVIERSGAGRPGCNGTRAPPGIRPT